MNEDEIPLLHPDEHAWLEEQVGRKLTNLEAQNLLKEARLEAAFQVYLKEKQKALKEYLKGEE